MRLLKISLLIRIISVNDLRSINAQYNRNNCEVILKRSGTTYKTIDPRIFEADKVMNKIINFINDNHDCQFIFRELMNVLPNFQTNKNRLHQSNEDNSVLCSYQELSTP